MTASLFQHLKRNPGATSSKRKKNMTRNSIQSVTLQNPYEVLFCVDSSLFIVSVFENHQPNPNQLLKLRNQHTHTLDLGCLLLSCHAKPGQARPGRNRNRACLPAARGQTSPRTIQGGEIRYLRGGRESEGKEKATPFSYGTYRKWDACHKKRCVTHYCLPFDVQLQSPGSPRGFKVSSSVFGPGKQRKGTLRRLYVAWTRNDTC